MIYLLRQSKGKKKEQRYVYSLEEAIGFLVSIKNADLSSHEWFVLGADKPEELQELKDYFKPEFFSLEEGMIGISVYRINRIKKAKRLKSGFISHKSVESFSHKIKRALGIPKVEFLVGSREICFVVKDYGTKKTDANVFLDHNLVIKSIEISSHSTYEEVDKVKKIVNTVLTKQRHYYKRSKNK